MLLASPIRLQRARCWGTQSGRGDATSAFSDSKPSPPPPPHLCGVRKVLNSGIKDARSHTHEVTPGSRLKGIVPDVFLFFLMHAVDPEMGLNLFSHSTVEFGHILVLAYRKLISYSS